MTDSPEEVCIEFCRRRGGYGCDTVGDKTLSSLLSREEYESCIAGNSVETTIDAVKVEIACTGCLNICSAAAAARIRVDNHKQSQTFRSTEEFLSVFQSTIRRSSEEWAEAEKPDFESEEAYKKWLREMWEKSKAQHQ